MIELRDGSVDEAEALVAVQKAASLAAFARVFPPERFPYPEQAVLADLRGRLTGGSTAIVAVDGERPVGFAVVEPGWLEQLYVLPERWGTGVGARLHDEAVERRRADGDSVLHLWTLEANGRSRAFYERRGWRLDGETRVVPYPPHPIDVQYTLAL